MFLDTSVRLEAVLAGAITTNQPHVHVDYTDFNPSNAITRPAATRTVLNSSTDVTILAAPPTSTVREVLSLTIYNADTATVNVTIKTDDTSTERTRIRASLLTLESLHYEKGRGWYATDASGEIKTA